MAECDTNRAGYGPIFSISRTDELRKLSALLFFQVNRIFHRLRFHAAFSGIFNRVATDMAYGTSVNSHVRHLRGSPNLLIFIKKKAQSC